MKLGKVVSAVVSIEQKKWVERQARLNLTTQAEIIRALLDEAMSNVR